jgi:hypothetical protein
MVFLCTCVIRGGKKPCVVDTKSKTARAFGLVVPMATCAILLKEIISNSVIKYFFIFVDLTELNLSYKLTLIIIVCIDLYAELLIVILQ